MGRMSFRSLWPVLLAGVFGMYAADMARAAEEFDFKALDRAFAERKAAILGSPNMEIQSTGTVYYVSNEGNDANPGKFEEGAWATLNRVNETELQPGDVVCFQRGGLWRGYIRAQKGVTYTAYGEGAKPRIYESPVNAADPKMWTETGTKNIYVWNQTTTNDIGTLVFNEGKAHAIKCIIRTEKDGSTFNNTTGEPFKTYADLKQDLHFYHDYAKSGKLYLLSLKGNPGERFDSIELNVKGNVIRIAGPGVTVDNLCVKYGGSHGVGSGTTEDLTVRNCEFGWIGGSIQAEGIFGRNHATRFGNAVEIYGGCRNYTVENCYFYQIYDAAVTHQFSAEGKPCQMLNVRYSGNMMEDCNYSVEYFLGCKKGAEESIMDGLVIENNLMRRAGEGFCRQRPDKTEAAHIKSWNHDNPAKNFIVRNNVFQDSFNMILHISSSFPNSMPKMEGNTYIQTKGASFGLFGQNANPRLPYDDTIADTIRGEKIGDKNAKVLFSPAVNMKTLVVVDVQRDFYHESGSLYVKGGEQAVSNIVKYINANANNLKDVVFTLDWHPYDSDAYIEPGISWPMHCAQNSEGAGVANDLIKACYANNIPMKFFYKGLSSPHTEYGAFETIDVCECSNGDLLPCGVNREGTSKVIFGTANFVVCGIAGDYCVQETIKNILKFTKLPIDLEVLTSGIASLDGGKSIDNFIKENNLKTI
ncbi:MAG: isochorismatase family protein [Verrucomicrobia bacterium]|nr:isochorismatase family protein [Verrucomicrobiota bacterium]